MSDQTVPVEQNPLETPSHHAFKRVAVCVLIAALSFALVATISLGTRKFDIIAIAWPMNALLVISAMRFRRIHIADAVLGYGAGMVGAGLSAGDPATLMTLMVSYNMLECLIVYGLMRYVSDVGVQSPRQVLNFLMVTILGCLASTAYLFTGFALTGQDFHGFQPHHMFLSHLSGFVLFGATLWILTEPGRAQWRLPRLRLLMEFLLLCFVAMYGIVTHDQLMHFLIAPILVLIAFDSGVRGVAISLVTLTLIFIPHGFFEQDHALGAGHDHKGHFFQLQVFLLVDAVLAYAVAATIQDRDRISRLNDMSRERLNTRARELEDMLARAHLAEKIARIGHWSIALKSGEIYWSPEVHTIHGTDPEKYDPNKDSPARFYTEDYLQTFREKIPTSAASGEIVELETIIIRDGDQTERNVHVACTVVSDKEGAPVRLVGVLWDETEERVALREAVRQEQKYRSITESSTDLIIQFSVAGVIEYASPAIAAYGLKPEQAVGLRVFDFLHPEDYSMALDFERQLMAKPDAEHPPVGRFRMRGADGKCLWMEGTPTVLRDQHGAPESIIAIFRDVTASQEREEALAHARAEAESAAQAKADFLANMSHEIRTPLNGILGFTQLLTLTTLNEEQSEYTEQITHAGRSLLAIVNDVLDFSKLEAGSVELDHSSFDLAETVERVTSLIQTAYPNPAVTYACTTFGDVATHVAGDEMRVRQILTNIIGNAAKFTSQGAINVVIRQASEHLVIDVEDTGCGIPADKLATIFDKFTQADSSITRKYGGTGLGLSISRSLAQLMGGDLAVTSEPGVGTTISVTLPLQRMSAPPEEDQISTDLPPKGKELGRIFVVDDVYANRFLVQAALGPEGYEVSSFASVEDLFLALDDGERPDVILMDVMMPDMDGRLATRKLRAFPAPVRDIPIIAMTGHTDPEEIAACFEAGMTAHIEKPLNVERLARLVADALSARPARADKEQELEERMRVLSSEYRTYLQGLPDEIAALSAQGREADFTVAIANLAHAIAGTAGSLGFPEVTDAARVLEREAKSRRDTPDAHLSGEITRFLECTQALVA